MIEPLELVKLMIPMLIAFTGAAWGAVKVALNGTQKHVRREVASLREEWKQDVAELSGKVDTITKELHRTREEVAMLRGRMAVKTRRKT